MKIIFVLLLSVVFSFSNAFSQNFATITNALENSQQFAGKEFRYSAFVKVEKGSKGNGALWIRVDKPDKEVGFFDNMGDRPIKTPEWSKFEITGTIDKEVNKIVFGCMLIGEGKLWVDNVALEFKNEKGEWTKCNISNSGFEEISDSLPVGWYTYAEDYLYTCDTNEAKEGKISIRIESKKEIKIPCEHIKNGAVFKLPTPNTAGKISVEEALLHRRSIRQYENVSLSLAEVSQMLWAAWGVTDSTRHKGIYFRTTPSAGARYPFEVYLIAGKVEGLDAGVYKYNAIDHSLTLVIKGDIRSDLCSASYQQTFVKKAPISIFWSAVFERTTSRYKERGRERYVCMDLGHSGENVYLQAEAIGLGTCAIGAFDDKEVVKLLGLPKEEEPLYIMPIGKLTKEELEKRIKQ